ncbi:sigma-70 family RNA polymerase sigma factor [Acutalibacter caecimuris]|uniref:sigma-70 family RNA polymerase sigma factor n=1 Tax=Acutalibacter caecimuris TaxID=3093657 RepID=UPI002AC9525D|nr:sigma-70 family RNA polymerase sigma factor [Acutalibacter sp. M00118]
MPWDHQLLVRLREQDPAALETAIRRYSPYVAAVAKKTLGPLGAQQDVEELTSDAFVALWQNAGKLRDDSDLKYWLAVVVRNAALRYRQKLGQELPLEENLVFDAHTPETEAERSEQARLVRSAVDGMESVDREIFLRHYFWRQTVHEIAGDMAKNQSAIKSRLARGREKLKKVLQKEDCLL